MADAISLRGVSKTYAGQSAPAVDALDLEVVAGEFLTLLGPSGCGKTTTLRMIAGFEVPDAGQVLLGGRNITALPPEARNMGMVFQSYALFPHRTVAQNVGFGLMMRKVKRPEADRRVADALALVRLTGFEDRYPQQLSGGQQQRVALARAVVINPAVLLCDEPLGALDKKLRQAMQFELKELHARLGLTLVYVTHDQEEALTMSDRIAVMRAGRIDQLASPQQIYDAPRTRFVADFIGDTNVIEGAGTIPLPAGASAAALRPERIRLAQADARISGTVAGANFLGDAVLLRVALPDGTSLLARIPRGAGADALRPGAAVGLAWNDDDLVPLAA